MGDNRLTLRIEAPERDVLALLRKVENVLKVDSLGSKEPQTVDVVVEARREADIRRPVFNAVAKAGYTVLMMKTMDMTLEDIFLNLITEEKEVS